MLDTLSASAAERRLTPGRFLLAAAFHGVILFAAARPAPLATEPVRARDILLDPYEPTLPEPARPERDAVSDPAGILPGPRDRFDAVTPDLLPAIAPLAALPAPDVSGLHRLSLPGPGTPDATGPEPGDGAALAVMQVDEPATPLRQPSPRYPPVLQQAGIEGRVLLEFIIDSTGHVESASLRVLERSRSGFDAAARESLERSLFRPARVRGRPVRQRARQTIVFRIG